MNFLSVGVGASREKFKSVLDETLTFEGSVQVRLESYAVRLEQAYLPLLKRLHSAEYWC